MSDSSNPNLKIRRTDMAKDCEEIVKLRDRVERHLDWHRDDALEYKERQLRQDIAHENNLKAIAELTTATKGLVDAWTTASNVQKFVKWLATFAVLGTALAWIISKLPDSWFN